MSKFDINNIPAEKFEFAQAGKNLHDEKFKTKPKNDVKDWMWVKFIQARSQAEGSTIVRQGTDDAASMNFWGCSSAGRAPALQAGGQEFDSPHLQSFEQISASKRIFSGLAYQAYAAPEKKFTYPLKSVRTWT